MMSIHTSFFLIPFLIIDIVGSRRKGGFRRGGVRREDRGKGDKSQMKGGEWRGANVVSS